MINWSGELPTQPGLYHCRCYESDFRKYYVSIYHHPKTQELLCDDDFIGHLPLQIYHDSLTDIEWLKVWRGLYSD